MNARKVGVRQAEPALVWPDLLWRASPSPSLTSLPTAAAAAAALANYEAVLDVVPLAAARSADVALARLAPAGVARGVLRGAVADEVAWLGARG